MIVLPHLVERCCLMIDTPQNCTDRASMSRAVADGPMLENVRRKRLASAAAWEGLARILTRKPTGLTEAELREDPSETEHEITPAQFRAI